MALTDYELAPTARRVLNIFTLVDCSGSMSGEKIAALNDAMRNVIPIVADISANNPDAEIRMACYQFGSSSQWITPSPVEASMFGWTDLSAGGWTPMGQACEELNDKLSHKHGFLKNASGSYAPVIIMLSDGCPTDDFNKGMTALNANNWFKHSTRIAIAIGNDADIDVLKTFTGNPELVLRVHNIDALKTAIKVVVVTSSMVCSQSSSATVSPAAMTVVGGTASGGTPVVATPVSKADATAAAINDELLSIDGISMGDEALMSEVDFDEFD
ncbi:MAG: VWA domain-containing protein [Bacteroides sp.]|nr:VWA domain-containing protein [Muribaculum sp.]MCM1333346.1 VWA domain-containing protein [Bacteroides sp.]